MPAVPFEQVRPYTHTSVMTSEVVSVLSPRYDAVIVDATAGGGGHSAAILEAHPGVRVFACDRDPRAVEACRERLGSFDQRVTVVHCAFAELEDRLSDFGVNRVDGILADLGVSSQQLADGERGMSFRIEGPLDMRMDPTTGPTALELIQELTQEQLADAIFQYGEERRSRRIARCIKLALADGELATTFDLRRAVVKAVGPQRVSGIDPATRTFQALRMAVNRELKQLRALLDLSARWLRPGGVAAFISFHSLEDRLVKRAFLDRTVWERLWTKPKQASEAERAKNPRARSAKLRAARRLVAPSPLDVQLIDGAIDGSIDE